MSADVDGWLADRLDEVPEELRTWLEAEHADGGEPEVTDELIRRGLAALAGAMARPGRDRKAAFRLLAADAYLTYACEAALEDSEPEPALRELVGRIAAGVE